MAYKHLPKKMLLLVSGDLLLFSLSLTLSMIFRFGKIDLNVLSEWRIISIIGTYLFVFYIANLYESNLKFTSIKYLYRFLLAVFTATTLVIGLFYLIPILWIGRGIFFINAFLTAVLTFGWRVLFEGWFRDIIWQKKRLLIVGTGKSAMLLYDDIRDDPNYSVIGFIEDGSTSRKTSHGLKIIGGVSELKKMIRTHATDYLIIAISHFKNPDLLKVSLACKMEGLEVYDMPSFYEEITGKIPVEHVTDSWLLFAPLTGVKKSIYNIRLKRMMDIFLSFTFLMLSLPIAALVCAAIKIDSRGPLFYRQKRIGLNDRIFEIVKFRSMRADAEKRGAVWASKNDSRVTAVGGFIRKTRLDEIPQMWNILKGEMSFIGPRPERPEFVTVLESKIPYYSLRHSVSPGLTGWAQVNYPYGASEEDSLKKLQYDLFYIKNLSPLLDFHILLKTIKVVIYGTGAR